MSTGALVNYEQTVMESGPAERWLTRAADEGMAMQQFLFIFSSTPAVILN